MTCNDLEEKANELYERVENYCNSIINGDIPACKKHIQACKRFYKFKENRNYYFDKLELLKVYIWARQFKHTKGVLAGKNIELVDIQLFEVGSIFAWKNKKDNTRVTRKVYIQKARKNVKTQEMAFLSTYVGFNSKNEKQEIYIAGWDKEQSNNCYMEIGNELATSDKLKGKYKESYGKITWLKDGSFIKPLSREARKTGDGTNPSVGIIDEYHAHKTSEIYDVINSGMVARKEPLMIIITTAGFDLSHPCYKEYQYVSKVLDEDMPEVENDEYFILITELEKGDDIKDERNWIKANPIVATYEEGIKSLRNDLRIALDAPDKMRAFLTKNMNMWVDMREDGFMDMSKWNNVGQSLEYEMFRGMDCIAGVDFSHSDDLTSLVCEFFVDNKYYFIQHSWMPEEMYEKRMRQGKYRFDLWLNEGTLSLCNGATIDQIDITNYIEDLKEKYNINFLEICYDHWDAKAWAAMMESKGYVMVDIPQTNSALNEPTKDFRAKIYSEEIIHNNDGLYSWSVGNAVSEETTTGYIHLSKKKSFEKIDPVAASINAHFRAMKLFQVEQEDIFYSPC